MGIVHSSRVVTGTIEVPALKTFLYLEYSDTQRGERTLKILAPPELSSTAYKNRGVEYNFGQDELPASKEKLTEILNEMAIAELKSCKYALPLEIGSAIEALD
ncbi:hypothetical protein KA107_01570 [Candidatus Pacearchaeota archaeon]|nr:hypothetical protein [Candidatus Pacearchaeota archaeon]